VSTVVRSLFRFSSESAATRMGTHRLTPWRSLGGGLGCEGIWG